MRKLACIALLLLLASFASAQPSWADTVNNAVIANWNTGNWQVLAILALLLTFFIVILAYMLSIIIGSQDLRRWAKSELIQVAASAVLVLGLIVVVSILTNAISLVSQDLGNIANTPPAIDRESPFSLAHYYLDKRINCAKTYYRSIFYLSIPILIIEKTTIPTGGMEEVVGWPLSGLAGFIHWIEHQLTFILLSDYFQRHLLVFIEDNMFAVFLPIGIILRVLPYTRGAGGVMIAVAMGLFLVYPTMYAVLLGVLPDAMCAATAPSVYTCETTDPFCIAYSMSFIKDERNYISLQNFLTEVGEDIRLLFVSSLLFPLINITVTLTFVHVIMQFLGADVAEMGHGLIKVI